jgi:segregation and condensation protein A
MIGEKESILQKLADKEKIEFEELFSTIDTRLHAIYHFLSILELVQEARISIIIGEGMNNFWITLKATRRNEAEQAFSAKKLLFIFL